MSASAEIQPVSCFNVHMYDCINSWIEAYVMGKITCSEPKPRTSSYSLVESMRWSQTGRPWL